MNSMDLVEFLTARLDEDGEAARAATGEAWEIHAGYEDGHDDWVPIQLVVSGDDVAESRGDHGLAYAEHIARHDPARVLADIAAKRQIIEGARDVAADTDSIIYGRAARFFAEDTLCLLALPYADHPDYRQEWKP